MPCPAAVDELDFVQTQWLRWYRTPKPSPDLLTATAWYHDLRQRGERLVSRSRRYAMSSLGLYHNKRILRMQPEFPDRTPLRPYARSPQYLEPRGEFALQRGIGRR